MQSFQHELKAVYDAVKEKGVRKGSQDYFIRECVMFMGQTCPVWIDHV